MDERVMSYSVDNKVVEIISKTLGLDPKKITPEKRIVKDLGADDLNFVEIIMGVEDGLFDIEIKDEEIGVKEDDMVNSNLTVRELQEIAQKLVDEKLSQPKRRWFL